MNIKNFENETRKFVANNGNFHVLEYMQDSSVSPANASTEYCMSKMGVHRRQVAIELDDNHSAIIQAGAMQWMVGNVNATTGVKGVGDLLGKIVKGAVTGESAIKPEYVGNGWLVLEPTYKYIILVDVAQWGAGMTIEDGMFYACSGTVKTSVVARKNLSSAALGGEGLFNLSLSGSGVAALESNVPYNELIEVDLNNDTLKINEQSNDRNDEDDFDLDDIKKEWVIYDREETLSVNLNENKEQNDVFNDLVTILGLKFGKDFDINDLNYGKIVISTDADVDGDRIAALLLLFFSNWPELINKHIVCRCISPIIIAKKGPNS